jgi:hypothetical protein
MIRALKRARQTALTEAMAISLDRSKPASWLAALGVTDAPVTSAGAATALHFFAVHMPAVSLDEQLSFLRGIDLHHAVREIVLTPGAVLAAFRHAAQNPFRLFDTNAGTSPHSLGVNPSGREFRRFRVTAPVTVLESRCASARETWSDPDVRQAFAGGGLQYIVPRAERVLALLQ